MARSLAAIAADIRRSWPKPYFGAEPYISAMAALDSINDQYGMDSAKSVVLYFLANSATFKGPDARRIKDELRVLAGLKK